MEQGKPVKTPQELRMISRRTLDISGVGNVESFDNEEFLLETSCGFMTVRGHHLHMKNLNLEQGLVSIEGTIDSIVYLDGGPGGKSKGLFGKLFK